MERGVKPCLSQLLLIHQRQLPMLYISLLPHLPMVYLVLSGSGNSLINVQIVWFGYY